MQNFSAVLKSNRIFFIGFFLLILFASFTCLYYTKKDGFYLLNGYHNIFLTKLFEFFTFLGDGFFCVAAGILIYFFKDRFTGVLVLSSYILSGLIAQTLKQLVIEARPAVLLKDTDYPNFIENVTLHNYHAFPSGHTASAFAMAAVISFSLKNKSLAVPLLLIASAIGYSRIYLAQHFLIDVLAGSIIGVLSAMICWCMLYNKKTAIENFRRVPKGV